MPAVLSLLVYREMDLKGLYAALLDTGKLAGIALFCVGTASDLRLAARLLQDPGGDPRPA